MRDSLSPQAPRRTLGTRLFGLAGVRTKDRMDDVRMQMLVRKRYAKRTYRIKILCQNSVRNKDRTGQSRTWTNVR